MSEMTPMSTLTERIGALAQLKELKNEIAENLKSCNAQIELYAFIDDVEDSRLRLILSARYIDGLSWQAIAFRIGETDEQVPRRLHNRLIQQKILENAKFDENDERSVL